MAKKKNAAAVTLGGRSGIRLTKAQRIERASRAATCRWRKAKPPAAPKLEGALAELRGLCKKYEGLEELNRSFSAPFEQVSTAQ